jgi:hypothetical protein
MVEGGTVGMTVGAEVCVSVAVGDELGVSVGNNGFVGVGGVIVLVLGWHAVRRITVNIMFFFNFLSIGITSDPIYK